jgi:hypothetical protein
VSFSRSPSGRRPRMVRMPAARGIVRTIALALMAVCAALWALLDHVSRREAATRTSVREAASLDGGAEELPVPELVPWPSESPEPGHDKGVP